MRATASLVAAGSLAALSSFTAGAAPPASMPAQPVATSEPESRPGLPNFARVSTALYRGAQPTREGFVALAAMGVKTVVDLRAHHDDRPLLAGTGLRYLRIRMNAWHPETEDVLEFLKLVSDPANQPVFVHCKDGADRTGLMIAAYRRVVEGTSPEAADAELQRFGNHVHLFPEIEEYVLELDPAALRAAVARTPEPGVLVVR